MSATVNQTAITPLGVNGLKLAEIVRNIYQITATAGTKHDDLLDPKYWSHVARHMRIGDKIEVISADGSWYAELRVMEVGRHEAFGVRAAFILKPVSLENENALPALNDYETRAFGAGWQVFKIGNPDPIKVDLPSRDAAEKWIVSQRKAMAA